MIYGEPIRIISNEINQIEYNEKWEHFLDIAELESNFHKDDNFLI